ncbi:hypothetical protein [Terrimonas pollutisoli]|nr:hypothetical protein [Terrimonas sp. H1YJ31]
MKSTELLFSKPMNLEGLETRFKAAANGIVRFFDDSCCIDTQPPLPPGNK